MAEQNLPIPQNFNNPMPQTSCIKIGHLFHIWTPILIQERTKMGVLFHYKTANEQRRCVQQIPKQAPRQHISHSRACFPIFPFKPRPIIVKWGVKNPPRCVKSNDSHPPHVRCVSPSHPRTQTSSPRRGGRWRALS